MPSGKRFSNGEDCPLFRPLHYLTFLATNTNLYHLRPISVRSESPGPIDTVPSSSKALDRELLLQRSDSPTESVASDSGIHKSRDRIEIEERLSDDANHLNRSVENGVLPETAVLGRNLGWYSAYILIMSTVIGSGIFATPGAIVRSVGSVGLTLLLWIAGALISWLGLAISLEYGCMLPRSGGRYCLRISQLRY